MSRYASAALNLATRLVRDRALAEDLTQDAFVRAFARLATYDPQRRFSAWFFQVLHNVVIDHLRRRRLDAVSLDALQSAGFQGPAVADAASSPERDMERRALGDALDAALQQIRPEYREPILLRYQQGLTIEEIATALSLPSGTVKTHLHRGRKELAAILATAGWEPGPS